MCPEDGGFTFFFFMFIYLAAPGHSCDLWDPVP